MQKISIVVDVQGKIFKTCVDKKIFYPKTDPKLTLTLTLSLIPGLGLGLAWGHFQNKYFLCTQVLKIFP